VSIDERIAMSEEKMLDLVQRALDTRGIDDQLVTVGQFNPRGHVGAMFVGGGLASEAGDLIGGVAGLRMLTLRAIRRSAAVRCHARARR
jgi:hypothetical protein